MLLLGMLIVLTAPVLADHHLPIGLLKVQEYNDNAAKNILQNVSFFLAFLAGMTSLFSPCILPLIPAYFAITFKEKKKITLATSFFFIGFSATFVFMGLLATFAGKTILSTFANLNWLIPLAGALFILFGIMILLGKGFPGLNIKNRFGQSWQGLIVSGILLAIGWTACIGPLVSGVLLMVSAFQNYLMSAILMIFYSLGIFVPLFIISFFYDKYHFERSSFLNKRVSFKFKGKEYNLTYPNIIAGIIFIALGSIFIIFRGTAIFNGLYFFGLKQKFYDYQNLFLSNSSLFNKVGLVVFIVFALLLYYFIRKEIKNTKK